MANKIIIGLLVVALVANVVIGYFVYMQKGDINALVEELTAARQEAAAEATAQAEQLETARQEITSLIGENTVRITGLEEGVEANLASIDEEAGRVTTLGNNLSALSSKVNGIVPGLAADEIYEQASMAVVEISDGDDTVGAGFIYDIDGHVVTAYHVTEDLNDIYVIFYDGTISPASIVGGSIRSDVSVLELENTTAPAPAQIGDSSTVAVGDHALVIGHPFDLSSTLTVGVVSQLDRFEGIGSGQDEHWVANLIQFDAPANFGNSGGPVFNADGDVIGMVIAGISPLIGDRISYAVSSNKIQRVADDIIENGRFTCPYIGVYVTDLTPTAAEAAGRETVRGALVENLVSTGPAADGGVQVGDIIVAIDDFLIDDVADLASYLGEYPRGGPRLYVHVVRDGTELTIEMRTKSFHSDVPWYSTLPEEH